jgi:type IV secretory pathway VirB9-like protein
MQTLAFLLILVLAAPFQRIETQYPDREKVTRVETAMNHLTVIELAEAVTLAAAGSPLFKIERRENKVFIQPLEEGASTNLFVWTGSGRWNYELVPKMRPGNPASTSRWPRRCSCSQNPSDRSA